MRSATCSTDSPTLRDQPWLRYHVKDGEKRPCRVGSQADSHRDEGRDDGLPGLELHLVVARNALDHNEVKFFVSNAPARDEGRPACCWSPSRDGAWNDAFKIRSKRSDSTSGRAAIIADSNAT